MAQEGAIEGSTAILFDINIASGTATKINTIANASDLGVYGLAFDDSTTSTPTSHAAAYDQHPNAESSRHSYTDPDPHSTPGQSPFLSTGPVPPTPPPAAQAAAGRILANPAQDRTSIDEDGRPQAGDPHSA